MTEENNHNSTKYTIEDEKKKIIENGVEKYIEELIDEILSGKYHRINLFAKNKKYLGISPEGLQFSLDYLENHNASELESLMVLGLFSQHSKTDYLETKPSAEKAALVLKKCHKNSLNEIFKNFQDDGYLAEVLLSFSKFDNEQLNTILQNTSDLYLRDLIYLKYVHGVNYTVEDIKQYEEIKEQFSVLKTEDEKVDFLTGLQINPNSDDNNTRTNKIKKSLLSSISSVANREKVIKSMTPDIDGKYQEYVDLAEKMIIDFFSTHGVLTQEEKEKIQAVFRTYQVIECDLTNVEVNRGSLAGSLGIGGDSNFIQKRIRLSKDLKYPEQILNVILHEFGHALTHENLSQELPINEKYFTIEGEEFEEGMAETFAEVILNSYITTPNKITINGKNEKLFYPYNSGAYDEFVLMNKAILYHLESSDEDIIALKDYFLGDKRTCYKMMKVDELFAQADSKDESMKLGPSRKMLEYLVDSIGDNDHESKYDIGFKHITLLKTIRKALKKCSDELEKKSVLDLTLKFLSFKNKDCDFITRDIDEVFDNRKLDKITSDELDYVGDLLSIYFSGSLIMQKSSFIKYKLNQMASEKHITLDEARDSIKLIQSSVIHERGVVPDDGKR